MDEETFNQSKKPAASSEPTVDATEPEEPGKDTESLDTESQQPNFTLYTAGAFDSDEKLLN